MENNTERRGSARRIMAETSAHPQKYGDRMVNRTPRPAGYEPPQRRRRKKKRGMSFGAALIIDAFAIGAFLLIFAYFHHVNPIFTKIDEPMTLPEPSQTAEEETPAVEQQPVILPEVEETAPEATVQPAEPQHKFEDKVSAETVHTDNQYITENVNVTVTTTKENGVIYQEIL